MFNYNTSDNPLDSMVDDEIITSSDLYLELPPDQRQKAIRNLFRYFEVIYQIWEEQEASGKRDTTLEETQLRQIWGKRFVKNNHESHNQNSSNPTLPKSDT